MASTAAGSAPSLSPRPIQRPAASAAASVTRTSSMARFRSGACRWSLTAPTIAVRAAASGRAGRARSRVVPGRPPGGTVSPWIASFCARPARCERHASR